MQKSQDLANSQLTREGWVPARPTRAAGSVADWLVASLAGWLAGCLLGLLLLFHNNQKDN
jgi:hypothetical protein